MIRQIAETWKNNKKFRIAVILECLLILLAAAGLFGHTGEIVLFQGEAADGLTLDNLSFGPGVYRMTVDYEAAPGTSSTLELTNRDGRWHSLYANAIPLPGELKGRTFPVWLTAKSSSVEIKAEPGEGTGLVIRRIAAAETNAGARIALFIIVSGSLLLDGLWVYAGFLAGREDEKLRKRVMWGLAGIIALVSVPLMTDYVPHGMDLIFHLVRIEGVKDGLLSGQFPVRIQPNWLSGYGYASSVFYGDVFLMIPACLRLLGFTVQTSYKLFLLLLNAGTALIAYSCFRRIFRDRYVGLIGSMLYTWGPFRFYDLYGRAALGEAVAITFLPILLYGFYRVFTEDIRSKEYGRLWILPTVGFTCILWSHTLSVLMAGGLVLLLCLILWKKVFRRQCFAVLAKIVGATALANAWFLVPFLDYYATGDFYIKHIHQTIQSWGVYLLHYFFTFFRAGSSARFDEKGMIDTEPLGVGFAVTVCMLAFLWLLFTKRYRKREEERELRRFGCVTAAAGAVVLVMSTNHFPWDALQRMNRLFDVVISSLQFPMRLLVITLLCFTFVSCMVLWQVRRWEKPAVGKAAMLAVIGIAFVTTQFLVSDTLNVKMPLRLYNAENIGNTNIMGSEYLPVGAVAADLTYGKYVAGPGVEVAPADEPEAGYGVRRLRSSFDAVNAGSVESYAEVPLLYYKGYRALDADTGQSMTVQQGDGGRVRVLLPEAFEGRIQVRFASPWYWRAAEAVSLCFVVWGAAAIVKCRKKP